jgi:hypothetical protein
MDKSNPKYQLLLARWNQLKKDYPWQNIKQEWDKYADWYEKKNGKDLVCNLHTIEWFKNTWLSKKPAPVKPIPTMAEHSELKKNFYSGQTAQALNLLEDEGLLTEEIKIVLNKAIFNEGATVHTLKDWMMGTGRPVYPNSKILLELIKKKYTGK